MHKNSLPPQPEKIVTKLEKHGDTRIDEYFWLNQRENPKVLDYLKAENAYTEAQMSSIKSLEEKLYAEIKGRVKDEEKFPETRDGDYYYSARYEAGAQYPIYFRRPIKGGGEEILLNVPEMAKGFTFYQSSGPRMSPNHKLLAFAVDTVGRRLFTLQFKDLETGKVLPQKIENVTGNMVWAADNETVFYSKQHPETLRSDTVYRYNLKTQKTEQVYFEKDEIFNVYVHTSLTDKYIYIGSNSVLTNEVRFLRSDNPQGLFKVFAPRSQGHEYSVTDSGDQFFIVSNRKAENFKVLTTDINNTEEKNWKEIVPHSKDVFIQDVTVFKDFMVLEEKTNGLNRLRIADHKGQNSYIIPFEDKSYVVGLGDNRMFATDWIRYDFESLRLPESVYDFNVKTREQKLVQIKEVPNYKADQYVTDRIFIKAQDGAEVPVSIIRHKDTPLDGTAPLMIYGYGSYGMSMEPWFRLTLMSLLDRGFVYSLAHIRGGSEMGRAWFENARAFNKKNTFNDFIDVTEGLIKQKYGAPNRVYAMGGSAGGLLMGAVMNMRPDLYKGIVAQVPFVDVVSTMLDESIPLTTGEYEQWGNPNEKAAYEYIKSYSPYDNIHKAAYPNILVTTGFHDSQVQYWEPAKWVPKLRENNTGSNIILLKTNLEAGHGGSSGRYGRLEEVATEYAFLLMIDGQTK